MSEKAVDLREREAETERERALVFLLVSVCCDTAQDKAACQWSDEACSLSINTLCVLVQEVPNSPPQNQTDPEETATQPESCRRHIFWLEYWHPAPPPPAPCSSEQSATFLLNSWSFVAMLKLPCIAQSFATVATLGVKLSSPQPSALLWIVLALLGCNDHQRGAVTVQMNWTNLGQDQMQVTCLKRREPMK